ncbi:MAG TPA: DinB family protein [Bryobacteraceae bacterium]|nr:DinB family protein [Bryobacteraceae bacterium]
MMNPGQVLLPEFDHEMANTRRALERVPDGKFGWKPHEKSGTLGWLAGHIAMMPLWAKVTLTTPGLDVMAGDEYKQPAMDTREQLLAVFDEHLADARATIEKATAETFGEPWTLRSGEDEIFTSPKAVVMRSFVMNHMIHHRAQLTVYLRMLDVPVPGLYGPSADEGTM